MGSTFLSYSRKQYYFAESLALHLQQQGISVWFDIQQLEPGVSWQADIESGLENADSVTLVASQAALESPYVAREWQHALDRGKPVFVVLYEQVNLPTVLRQRAFIVDFRGSFDQGVRALLAQYRTPARGRLAGRLSYPPGVARTALALTLYDVRFLMVGALYALMILLALSRGALPRLLFDQIPPSVTARLATIQPDSSPSLPLSLALVALLIVWSYVRVLGHLVKVVRFLRHEFDYSVLVESIIKKPSQKDGDWYNVALQLVTPQGEPIRAKRPSVGTGIDWLNLLLLWSLPAIGYGLITYAPFPLKRPASPEFSLPLLVALLVAISLLPLANRVIRGLMPRHPNADVVRWAKPGSVPQAWREYVNRGLLTNWTLPTERAIHEIALVAVRDVPTAVQAAPPTPGQFARTYRLVFSPGDEKSVQAVQGVLSPMGYHEAMGNGSYTILILSYRTSRQMIREAFKNAQQVIGILVTDIHVPRDLPELTSLQLVDFRSSNAVQLQSALKFLHNASEEARASFSQYVMPVNLAPVGTNGELADLFTFLMLALFASVVYILIGTMGLSQTARSGSWGWPIPDPAAPSMAGFVGLLVLDLILLWYGLGTLRGTAYLRRPLLILVIAISIAVLGWVQLVDAPRNLHTPTPYIGLGLIGFYILALILMALWIFNVPYLLVLPGTGALGKPATRPKWGHIGIGVLIVFLLLVSGLLPLCVVPVLALIGLFWAVARLK